MRKIGLKYCGNCNPQINSGAIVNRLMEKTRDKFTFVSWEAKDIDLLLIMSGCATDCATRPDYPGPIISVGGEHVNLRPCYENELVDRIFEAIEAELDDKKHILKTPRGRIC